MAGEVVVVVAGPGGVAASRLSRLVKPTGSCPITAGRSAVTSAACRLIGAVIAGPHGGPNGRVTRTSTFGPPGVDEHAGGDLVARKDRGGNRARIPVGFA